MRLIDADALYEQAADTAEHYCGFFNDMEKVICARDIDAAPTIEAVPVVRCRDCRWWDEIEGSPMGYCHACKHGHYSRNWEISIYRTYKGDFFCADGERKDGDGNG